MHLSTILSPFLLTAVIGHLDLDQGSNENGWVADIKPLRDNGILSGD